MERLLSNLKIVVNENIYVKDPQSSNLGKRIIEDSILLINELGFENFTFKKLGVRIGSNESSIYRYFENKHKLLLYLTSWYWGRLEYQLVFSTNSINDPVNKLKKAIEIVTKPKEIESEFSDGNEAMLHKIIINEYSKSYLTKEVDAENKEGCFVIYKRLVSRISEMIKEVDRHYLYPSSLASTILEGSLHQHFLKDHFVSLTDCHSHTDPTKFLTDLVFRVLNTPTYG